MDEPNILWSPSEEQVASSQMAAFLESVNASRSDLPQLEGYRRFINGSIDERAVSGRVASRVGMKTAGSIDPIELSSSPTLGGRFFPNLTLNFAENLLRYRDDRPACVSVSETRDTTMTTYAELYEQVHRVRRTLESWVCGPGDRVAGVLPNITEAIVAMLAAQALEQCGLRVRPILVFAVCLNVSLKFSLAFSSRRTATPMVESLSRASTNSRRLRAAFQS